MRTLLLTLLMLVVGCMPTPATTRKEDREKFRQVLWSLIIVAEDRGLPGRVIVDSAGNELYSWRYSLLKTADPIPMSSKLPVADFSVWNSSLHAQITESGYGHCFMSRETTASVVFAIDDPGSALPEKASISGLAVGESVALAELPQDVILLIQVRQNAVLWNQPGDLRIKDMRRGGECDKLSCVPEISGSAWVGFADGELWNLSPNTPIDKLSLFFTVESARTHSREDVLGQFKTESLNVLR